MKTKFKCIGLVLAALIYIFAFSCKTENLNVLSAVEIAELTNITTTAATAKVEIAGDLISARGVCWSTAENPTIADSKTSDGAGGGVFSGSIAGLLPGTTYYVRAYAISSSDTIYSKQLAFTSSPDAIEGSKMGLYIYDVDAKALTKIINEGSLVFYLFSPDTKKIFYLYSNNLYSLNIDGSQKTLILPGLYKTGNGYPAWSPDGSKIAFMKNQDIYLANSDGKDVQQLTNFGKGAPPLKWSKDGQKISLYGYDNGSKLYYATMDGNIHLIADKGSNADWSGDSQEIVYTVYSNSISQIYKFSIGSNSSTSISTGFYPHWNPVENKILFISGNALNGTSLTTIKPDGTQSTTILSNALTNSSYSWSPDNKYITYISNYGNVSIIDADGQNSSVITDVKSTDVSFDGCTQPVWSPDSKYLLFCRGRYTWTL